jgi:hypothetical protein
MIVSERETVENSLPARWSYPRASAIAGWPGSETFSAFCAIFTSLECARTDATDW